MSKTFSERFAELRKQRHISQRDLAYDFGVSPNAVFKWENGSEPNYDTLEAIANYFKVSVDYLVGNAPTAQSAKADPAELELLRDFRRLNPLQRGQVLGYTRALANSDNTNIRKRQ